MIGGLTWRRIVRPNVPSWHIARMIVDTGPEHVVGAYWTGLAAYGSSRLPIKSSHRLISFPFSSDVPLGSNDGTADFDGGGAKLRAEDYERTD